MDKETINYIIRFYGRFMTLPEKLAMKHFSSQYKLDAYSKGKTEEKQKRMREIYLSKGWLSSDLSILDLLSDGIDEFERKAAETILKEHSSEIHFNNCPKCGKLARTPQAKQCRHCYHDWH